MKQSELKQIIKEEINKALNGNIIHTVIVYMNNGEDVDFNDVKSFKTHDEAYNYAEGLKRNYDIIPNTLES